MSAPYDNDYGSPDMYEQGKVEEPTREEVIAWLESVSAEWPNRSPAAEYSCFKEVALFRHAARLLREPPPEAFRAEVARTQRNALERIVQHCSGDAYWIAKNALSPVSSSPSPTPEVSRMEPFPLVPIPPQEVERERKAFFEKLFPHTDADGQEPYDWREVVTLEEAIAEGFFPKTLEIESDSVAWYNFKRHRALTWTDPERPGWEAFRGWALEILNGPSTPVPDPWPVYDAAAYQAERLRRASADE